MPEIKVAWDAGKQTVTLDFDREAFKTWDMVMAVLEMTKSAAEFQRDMQRAQAAQQQAMQQMQAEAMRGNLKL